MAILRISILCAVVAMAVGCSYDASIPDVMDPIIPGNGIHKIPPKKTITIKRKKPTIGNPSPRPLSAEMPCEEMYEEYAEYEEYEEVNEE
ncbi:MAG: hypothetical protein IIW45_06815 [Alistipes sp.]|nr:hypothetical protein [Alistipes sp.]